MSGVLRMVKSGIIHQGCFISRGMKFVQSKYGQTIGEKGKLV